MKQMFNHVSNRLTGMALGAAIVLAGTAVAFTQKPNSKPSANIPVDERPITRDLGGRASFAPVVKKVTPGVLKVFTTTRAHNTAFTPENGGGGPGDDMLRRFFGDNFQGQGQGRMHRNFNAPRQQGIGSGVIV